MIDHFGLYCRDADKSLPFFRAALAPVGIEVVEDQPHLRAAIFMRKSVKPFWWLGEGSEEWRSRAGQSRLHVGFTAESATPVDAFYAAALASGGADNGPPGYRSPKVYSAFIIDPDGNNVEAIWRPVT